MNLFSMPRILYVKDCYSIIQPMINWKKVIKMSTFCQLFWNIIVSEAKFLRISSANKRCKSIFSRDQQVSIQSCSASAYGKQSSQVFYNRYHKYETDVCYRWWDYKWYMDYKWSILAKSLFTFKLTSIITIESFKNFPLPLC